MASGKGTAARYLKEQHGATVFRFSTMLRDLLDRLYLEQSRDNMVVISEVVRKGFGDDIMARVIAEDASRADTPIVAVDGVRRTADITHLSKLSHFVLVEVFADAKVRYDRLHTRGENTDDATKTFEQFLADHERSTEATIPEVAAKATERIDNNSTTDDLHRELDALVQKYTT